MIFFLRFYLLIIRERVRDEEREGEKYQCVVAFHTPPSGHLARNPGHLALTWNHTGDPLVHRQALNPLSHTSQVF